MKTRSERINAALDERDKHIVKLLHAGETYQSIAEIAGCSISKVYYVAKEHGLTRRNIEEGTAE